MTCHSKENDEENWIFACFTFCLASINSYVKNCSQSIDTFPYFICGDAVILGFDSNFIVALAKNRHLTADSHVWTSTSCANKCDMLSARWHSAIDHLFQSVRYRWTKMQNPNEDEGQQQQSQKARNIFNFRDCVSKYVPCKLCISFSFIHHRFLSYALLPISF